MAIRRLALELRRSYSNNIITSPFGRIEVPSGTIDQYIMEHWSKWEDKTAIECVQTGRSFTYKEVRKRSKSFGCSLAQMGMARKTALFVLPNYPEFPVAFLGALQAGMTVTAANPLYTPRELKHQACNSGAHCVVTESGSLERVLEAVSGLGLPVISIGGEGVISFEQMSSRKDPDDSQLPTQGAKEQQLATLLYSSGTTGLPKGVRSTHRNIMVSLAAMSQPMIHCFMDTTESHQDVVPAVVPFFHIFGTMAVMLRSMRWGAKIISMPKFDPGDFLEILGKNEDIVLNAVPSIINFLGHHPIVKSEMLQGLRFTMTGGAACKPVDVARIQEKKPHCLLQGYGMTEASGLISIPPTGSTDTVSIGHPISNTSAKVVDPGSGVPLKPGLKGELCFKGPQLMEGYHNNPKATADTIDSDGWLHTGDYGYADEEGKLFIVDRIKELIKVKGFQVAPAELEALLHNHPKVADAGVTSTICPRSGELPVAFLVPATGCSIDPNEVSAWISDQVAPYKRLAKVLVVNEIPKSPSGKLLRRQLKEMVKVEIRL